MTSAYAHGMPRPRNAGPGKKVAAKKSPTRGLAAKKRAGATAKRGRRALTAEHKAQMARGREEARIVRAYLEAIDVPKRRGRQRTAESIAKQLSQIEERLHSARGVEKLDLLKQQRDLETERAARAPTASIAALERDFTKVARAYGARKGIDYSIWRAAGVSASVLTKARIQRTRRSGGL
jgi:hypothetical protein